MSPSNRPYSILLVEDNPDDEALTLRALKQHHVQNNVHVCRDGAEALEYLFGNGNGDDGGLKGPDLPQVVLLDLRLPKVDGLQVLKRIRDSATTRLLPVVVLTSSDEERDIVQSYQLGANSFVRKPVEFTEFIDGVRQLGLYWLLVNRPPAPT